MSLLRVLCPRLSSSHHHHHHHRHHVFRRVLAMAIIVSCLRMMQSFSFHKHPHHHHQGCFAYASAAVAAPSPISPTARIILLGSSGVGKVWSGDGRIVIDSFITWDGGDGDCNGSDDGDGVMLAMEMGMGMA